MSTFSEFKISRETEERIDRYLTLPVWGMLAVTEPVEFRVGEGPQWRITRENCRKIGMSPMQIVECVRDGTLELLP